MGEPRRIRVLWFIKGLGPGGAEQLLVNSLPHLDRERFAYEVAYLLAHKDDRVAAFESHGVPVHCLDGRHPLALMASARRLARLLAEREIDVVDAHLPYSGVIARLAARRAGTPVQVYTEHNLTVQRSLTRFRFLSFAANAATYGLVDTVVAVSGATRADAERVARGRVPTRLVYNGIPLDAVRPNAESSLRARRALGVPDGHLVVGHVATMTAKKGQADLLRAAQDVLRTMPEVTFVVVGKGPLEGDLADLARQLGIASRVIFTGYLPEPLAAIGAFDLLALASIHEGLPTVAIEAQALGVPVVATRVGGTSEVVEDGVTGLLVPPRRPGELAGALLALLGDGERRREMGAAAERLAHERFDIRRRVREVEDLYRELLGTSRAPARP